MPAIAADPGRQPVEPVEEVDHVHHRHDPDDRERHADRGRQVDRADEREREVVDPDAERGRDRRGEHLTRELRDRVEAAEVVDGADHARHGGAEQDASHLAGEVEKRERRHDDPEEDREPSETRDRPAVDAALVRPVDDAEHARHAADGGREQDDDAEGDQGSVENLRRRPQIVEHGSRYFVPYRRSPASPRPGTM